MKKYLLLIPIFLIAQTCFATLATPTQLTQGSTAVSATSYTTASITPTANQTVIIMTWNSSGADNVAGPTSITGCNLTWSSSALASQQWQGTVGTNRRISTVWTGVGSSPTTGAITIHYGSTMNRAFWDVEQMGSDVDTTGTGGSNAVVQSNGGNSGTTNVNTMSTTLSAFGSVNNGAMVYEGMSNNNTVFSAKSGWTQIGNLSDASSQTEGSEFIGSNDTAPSWTNAGAGISFILAFEIKASGGTPAVNYLPRMIINFGQFILKGLLIIN